MDIFKDTKKKKIVITAAIIGFIIILETVFVVVSIPDKIVGMWTLDEATSYQFDGRGRGVMHLSVSEYEFSYKLGKDDLYIDFDDDNATDREYRYELDGDLLTLRFGDQTYELWKG